MTKRPPHTPMVADPAEPQYVRDLLQAGREYQVGDYDFDKGLRKHLGMVAAGAPMPDWAKGLEGAPQAGSAGAGAASAGAAGAGIAGWIALPIVTATLVGAVLYATREPEPAAKLSVPVVSVTPSAPPVAAPAEPAAAVEPVVSPSEPAKVSEREPATARATRTAASSAKSAPVKAAASDARPARAPQVTLKSQAPSSAPAASSSDLFASAKPAVPSERAQAPVQAAEQAADEEQAPARPEPVAKRAEPVLDDARLEREMGMLAVTQRVLHSDPARALNLARQGEAEFGGSMFTQERQQLLLLSLVKLGRMDEARRLAKPYLARYPNGPFSDRVRRALATGRVER